MCTKKGAHRPAVCTQSRPVCAFSRLQILAVAGMALYNNTGHEHTSHGGRASDGCRPKLHRWPFSVLSLVSPSMPLSAAPAFLHNREQIVPTVATSRKGPSADAYTAQAHAPQVSGPSWM